MATDEVTLFLVGTPEHRGHVLAHVLRDKLDKFLKTFGGFERAYIGKRVRQTDFEITTLSPGSAHLGLHPVPRVPNYFPAQVVDWTLSQWSKIIRGEKPDPIVDEELVADIVELGDRPEGAPFQAFVISYASHRIDFDDTATANALAIRSSLLSARGRLPWMKGLSRGALSGELRNVLDASNERQIVICPPLGDIQIRCVFSETHRDQIKEYLFTFVRVTGVFALWRRISVSYSYRYRAH
jgi:hypothetical protein